MCPDYLDVLISGPGGIIHVCLTKCTSCKVQGCPLLKVSLYVIQKSVLPWSCMRVVCPHKVPLVPYEGNVSSQGSPGPI